MPLHGQPMGICIMFGFIITLVITILGGVAFANILVWWQALILSLGIFVIASGFKEVKK